MAQNAKKKKKVNAASPQPTNNATNNSWENYSTDDFAEAAAIFAKYSPSPNPIPPTSPKPVISPEDLKELRDYGHYVIEDRALVVKDQTALWDHNRYYSNILGVYTSNTRTMLESKSSYKETFYSTSINILQAMSLMFVFIILFAAVGIIADNTLEIILTALGGFLTTFIVIPHSITKYLFNEKEEENMCKIVANIQNYDSRIRDGINKVSGQKPPE